MVPVSKTLFAHFGLLLLFSMETMGFSVCPVIPPFVNNLCSDTVSSQRDKSIFIENHRSDQNTRCHCRVNMDRAPAGLSSETVRFVLLTTPVNGNYCPGMNISIISEGRRIFTFDCKKAAYFVPIMNPQAGFHVQTLNTEQKAVNKSAICISMSARVTMSVDCSKTSLVPSKTGRNAPIEPMMMNTSPQPWQNEGALIQDTQQPSNGGLPAGTSQSPVQFTPDTATNQNVVSKPYIRLGGRLTDTNPTIRSFKTMRSLKSLSQITFPQIAFSANKSPTGSKSRKHAPAIAILHVRTRRDKTGVGRPFLPPQLRRSTPTTTVITTTLSDLNFSSTTTSPLSKVSSTTPKVTVASTTAALSKSNASYKFNDGQGSNRIYVGTHSAVAPVVSNLLLMVSGLVMISYLPC